VSLVLDDAARRWIGQKGYDPKMGARPMTRVIQEHIKRPLAEELLFGRLAQGGQVTVSVGEDGAGLRFDFQPNQETELASSSSAD
jgi:ATP-dependent Clp protease ATP-binding subunit ClpA